MQSYGGGVRHLSVDTIEPIARRAVLFDIAGAAECERSRSRRRDHARAVWSNAASTCNRATWYWFAQAGVSSSAIPSKYASALRMPGVELAGAKWLSARKPFAVGSDTLAFERYAQSEDGCAHPSARRDRDSHH